MNFNEKRAYLESIKSRYKKATRQQKQKILDEFCATTGYNRKYVIYALGKRKNKRRRKKPGRQSSYNHERILTPLRTIWLFSDFMCSKKLKSAIPDWLPYYEKEHGALDERTRNQLHTISPSTIDRLLKVWRPQYPGKGRSGTKPGRLLKNQIPIKTDHWDVTKPGFLEADTVAHCGNSLAGDFVWSITLTDILTTWTENRATWNKGADGVKKNIKNIEKNLPFELLGFDCDNGSEFLNWHLVRYFTQRKNPVQFTRSRPYRKNDNAHVEQKNWTHVRHLFGYERFDKPAMVNLMNDLYRNEYSRYQNHFIPTMKLVKKEKINSKYRKKYDTPKTPYQRVMESEHVDQATKDRLAQAHSLLNPFVLKRTLERKLKKIFSYLPTPKKIKKPI